MTTRSVDLSCFIAAASAMVITAVSAAAFVSSSASIERDPFRFASIVTASVEVQVVQSHGRTPSACPNNPEASDHRAPVCLRG
jgi:hypothetical protein